jgi:hypothetical protein
MSVMTVMPGTAFLTAWTALRISASSRSAALPSSSFRPAPSLGKSATAATPSFRSCRHSFTKSAIERRDTPGIEPIGSGRPLPSTTKSGAIRFCRQEDRVLHKAADGRSAAQAARALDEIELE